MNKNLRPVLPLLLVAVAAGALLRFFPAGSNTSSSNTTRPSKTSTSAAPATKSDQVSALGYLAPSGNVHVLAAPAQIAEGVPRVLSLRVHEGQHVRQGQVLAIFDTIDRVNSQKGLVDARIASIRSQVRLLENETSRFRKLADQGVFPAADLEIKELKLLELKSELRQTLAELQKVETERQFAFLRAPISGTILKILVRTGERPGPRGVLEMGATDRMMAVVQVNEDDIRHVRLGQAVSLRSENNSFTQKIMGEVSRIAYKVGDRKQLSSDPRADSDWESRTIDVEVEVDADQAPVVARLTGAKVVAVFKQ